MSSQLLTEDIWPSITKLCRSGPAYVAVAYLGNGGRKRLPLKTGSVLVVNASLAAVRAGQTRPAELIKFVRAGVEVHSAADLHAKVFAFPSALVVGSTNVSGMSAGYYHEAAVRIFDRSLIKQARVFVSRQAGDLLPLARLRQLEKEYRPPRNLPGGKPPKPSKGDAPHRDRLWIADLEYEWWDHEDVAAEKRGRRVAKGRLQRDQSLAEFSWPGSEGWKLERGDRVLQVMWEGKRVTAYPLATVIHHRRWRSKNGDYRDSADTQRS